MPTSRSATSRSDDFASGSPKPGFWDEIVNGVVKNTFDGRTESLIFGDVWGGRSATTTEIDTTTFKSLQFDLIYGDGLNGGDYNNSPISLKYSTNNGASWQTLQSYSLPGQWTRFYVNLPVAAQSPKTFISWGQNGNYNPGDDVWALDNIAFNTTPFQPPSFVDFSNDLNDGLFSDIRNGRINSTFAGRTKSLFFGDVWGGRELYTVPIDTTTYKSLRFDLIYGDGLNGGERNGSPVSLEYSTNNGASWQALQSYSLPGQWTRFYIDLPVAAQSPKTLIWWGQNGNFNAGDDVWAIDNIGLRSTPFQHPTFVNFNNDLNDGLFSDIDNGKISTTTGPTKSLFFGDVWGSRSATLVPIDTRKYRSLEFDLLSGGDIFLDYSTNQGSSWFRINSFNSSGNWGANKVDLPSAAQSPSTLLRWSQSGNYNINDQSWALDNIRLIGPPPVGDVTPPTITTIAVEGNALRLSFSEPIVSTGLSTGRFSATVGDSSRAVTTINAGSTNRELLLGLSGDVPRGSEAVRLSYFNPRGDDLTGVIQDAAGNDMASITPPGRAAETYSSTSSVTALATAYTRLNLLGAAPIEGRGNNLANTISGNSGNNRLNGLGGNDVISGGLGADTFRFASPLNAATNRDQIVDFNPAQGDRIELENGIFTALATTGPLAASAFTILAATTAAQRIVYNPTNGNLTYDTNGSSPGGTTVFATLPTGLTLTSSDFIVS